MKRIRLLWLVPASIAITGCIQPTALLVRQPERPLKSITINTMAYAVEPGQVDRRSVELRAPEDLHVVAVEHFNGVQKGGWSDNGHLLSLDPANPWEKWKDAGTGMEPTGAAGYFGYCGRDYYTEVGGIDDVIIYEAFPCGTHFFVPRGAALYLHTYANNFLSTTQHFHHAVRLLYW
ncbi:MAG: hypothetical protein JXA90_07470 [Planctomycetes bacterium]|nr:hypothetical protein [Planctomycetota bacterium]